jgi:hypothetical protein
MGRTVRSICCAANDSGSKVNIVGSKCVTREFFFRISDFIVIGFVIQVSLTLLKNSTMVHLTLEVDVVSWAVRMLKPGALWVRGLTG